jgi:hypothetical protein
MAVKKEGRSSISKAQSYWEIGEFWDTHDLADFWGKTRPVEFDVNIESEVTYYAIDRKLSDALQKLSTQRGIAPETLLNLWVQEKLKKGGNKSGNTEKPHVRGKKVILQY